MAQGRAFWLKAKTQDNVVNVHQATAKRHDLQRQVTYLLRAMIDAALMQRRVMGCVCCFVLLNRYWGTVMYGPGASS